MFTNMCMVHDDDGNILVQDRRSENWPGLAFPGGHVELGESFVESVKREVLEETGLTIYNPVLCGVKQGQDMEDNRYVVLFYKANEFSGTLTSSDEGEVFWIHKCELGNYTLANDFEHMFRIFESDSLSEFYYYKLNRSGTRSCCKRRTLRAEGNGAADVLGEGSGAKDALGGRKRSGGRSGTPRRWIVVTVEGVSHLTFIVEDLGRTARLFKEAFGATQVYASGDKQFSVSREKFLLLGGVWIALMEGEGLTERTYDHVAFKVPAGTLDDFERRLLALGVEVTRGRSRVEGEGDSIYFYDYDNHMFELHTGTLETRLRAYGR